MVNRIVVGVLLLGLSAAVVLSAQSGHTQAQSLESPRALSTQAESVQDRSPPESGPTRTGDARPRRLAVFVDGERDDLAFAEALLAAIAREREDIIVRRGDDPGGERDAGDNSPGAASPDGVSAGDAPPPDTLDSIARTLNTDAWLRLTLGLEDGMLSVEFAAHDLLTGVRSSGSYATPAAQIREFQHRAWLPILDELESIAAPREQAGTLRVRAEPGTSVQVDAQPSREVTESGELVYELPVPGTYRIRASRPGTWPAEQSVSLEEHRLLDLDLERAPRFAGQISLYNAQFPELGVLFFPRRRSFFLGAGVTSFALGYALRDVRDEDDPRGVAVSVPLTTLSLSIGSYLAGPERQTRAYLGLQPFMRISHHDGLAFEALAPVGVAAQLGLEYRPFRRGGLFLEWLPTAYPTNRVEELLEHSRESGGTLSVGTGIVYAELVLLRLGYRHHFSAGDGR